MSDNYQEQLKNLNEKESAGYVYFGGGNYICVASATPGQVAMHYQQKKYLEQKIETESLELSDYTKSMDELRFIIAIEELLKRQVDINYIHEDNKFCISHNWYGDTMTTIIAKTKTLKEAVENAVRAVLV